MNLQLRKGEPILFLPREDPTQPTDSHSFIITHVTPDKPPTYVQINPQIIKEENPPTYVQENPPTYTEENPPPYTEESPPTYTEANPSDFTDENTQTFTVGKPPSYVEAVSAADEEDEEDVSNYVFLETDGSYNVVTEESVADTIITLPIALDNPGRGVGGDKLKAYQCDQCEYRSVQVSVSDP